MQTTIDFGSHRVPLFWAGDIRAGVDVFAVANNLQSALIAVEMLLDEQGHRCLWYGPELIMEDGVFRVVLINDERHWHGWNKAERLEMVSRFRS